MALETQSSGILRFATFEVDLRAGELRKQGKRIKLQEQPFHVLTVLLQRPGQVVTREELRNQNWPADTFVDFDNSLNTAINKLAKRWATLPTTRDSSRRCRDAGIGSSNRSLVLMEQRGDRLWCERRCAATQPEDHRDGGNMPTMRAEAIIAGKYGTTSGCKIRTL